VSRSIPVASRPGFFSDGREVFSLSGTHRRAYPQMEAIANYFLTYIYELDRVAAVIPS
jgi:hypothetical protein